MDLAMIDHCKIFPGIGIARVGNSPEECFLGPEAPALTPYPGGGYKDGNGCIKRQGARFRVYAFDAEGTVLGEVTHGDNTSVTWNVHLANKKGAWYWFGGKYFQTDSRLRNPDIQGGPDFVENPDRRDQLIIDSGPRTIASPNQSGVKFVGGKFLGMEVPLGELRTDSEGRLIVLGGYGKSASVNGEPITEQGGLNNPGWYDDVSDGPIRATVKIGEREFEAEQAWVIVGPPNYAPAINSIVTLYDVVKEVSDPVIEDKGQMVSFYRDVYPILHRAANLAWVNQYAFSGHGPGKAGDFQAQPIQSLLSYPGRFSKAQRKAVLKKLRIPVRLAGNRDVKQATESFMPRLYGDWFAPTTGNPPDPREWSTVLESQYQVLKQWEKGNFDIGVPQFPSDFDKIPLHDQPDALNRASLSPCVGGPFAPGIEITHIAYDASSYSRPFRFAAHFRAGDITRYMSLPWQDDFSKCNTAWWPAQRPDCVLPDQDFKPGDVPKARSFKRWARGLTDQKDACGTALDGVSGANAMVELWTELGFVVPKTDDAGNVVRVPDKSATDETAKSGQVVFVEKERNANIHPPAPPTV